MNCNALPSCVPFAVRALIIDLDGTLIDARDDLTIALNTTLEYFGLPRIDQNFVTVTMGRGTRNLVQKTLEHVTDKPVEELAVNHALMLFLQSYQLINGRHAVVFPGVAKGLEALKKMGFYLACLTNKPSALVGPLLVEKGLAGFFDCIFGGDAFVRQKPDPLPVLRTCGALHTRVGQCLMVGDSSNDAKAARAAGCPIVLVSYGFNHGRNILHEDADLVIDRFDDLPKILTKI